MGGYWHLPTSCTRLLSFAQQLACQHWPPRLCSQGSTTGQKNGNDFTPGGAHCRGTGGAVTWQVDRGCHKISARAFDNLCRQMLNNNKYPTCGDDMSGDTYPHNSRETTHPAITTNQVMKEGVDFSGK